MESGTAAQIAVCSRRLERDLDGYSNDLTEGGNGSKVALNLARFHSFTAVLASHFRQDNIWCQQEL